MYNKHDCEPTQRISAPGFDAIVSSTVLSSNNRNQCLRKERCTMLYGKKGVSRNPQEQNQDVSHHRMSLSIFLSGSLSTAQSLWRASLFILRLDPLLVFSPSLAHSRPDSMRTLKSWLTKAPLSGWGRVEDWQEVVQRERSAVSSGLGKYPPRCSHQTENFGER